MSIFMVFFIASLGFTIVGFLLIGIPMLFIWAAVMVWFVIDVLKTVDRF